MKWLGMVCILMGCSGIGFLMARELEQRIWILVKLQQAMLLLQGELRCSHQTLAECFHRLSGRLEPPFSDFFKNMGTDLHKRCGTSAEEIWKQHLQDDLRELEMGKAERLELERLGRVIGYLDIRMQLEALEECLGRLKMAEEEARSQASQRRKLYRYMGMLGGIFLVLLVV